MGFVRVEGGAALPLPAGRLDRHEVLHTSRPLRPVSHLQWRAELFFEPTRQAADLAPVVRAQRTFEISPRAPSPDRALERSVACARASSNAGHHRTLIAEPRQRDDPYATYMKRVLDQPFGGELDGRFGHERSPEAAVRRRTPRSDCRESDAATLKARNHGHTRQPLSIKPLDHEQSDIRSTKVPRRGEDEFRLEEWVWLDRPRCEIPPSSDVLRPQLPKPDQSPGRTARPSPNQPTPPRKRDM